MFYIAIVSGFPPILLGEKDFCQYIKREAGGGLVLLSIMDVGGNMTLC